jgi:opacity protein-like surface antigen
MFSNGGAVMRAARRQPNMVIMVLAVFVFVHMSAVDPARAKDFKTMPSFETGGRWLFAFDENSEEITIRPGFALGGTFTQIIDFEWARNMAFELNYLHSVSHGEQMDVDSGDKAIFDITADFAAMNIGYYFTGRKILPYISAGPGVALFKYEPESAEDKIWEQTLLLNIGGGADWTIWEPEGGSALDKILLGARVRYEYVFVNKLFSSSLNSLAITGRAVLRF